MNKKNLKKYTLWAAVLAFIPMVLQAIGKDILPKNYQELCGTFLGILVLAGIVNSPNTKEDK